MLQRLVASKKHNVKMENKRIAILLATYNGERFLREQIESLYAQTLQGWTVYVHDDGSTDGTKAILDEYAQTKDNFVVLDYPSQGGASANFFSLLKFVNASYYFFADQDDVWMAEKMERCMARMELAENEDTDRPVLVCCDACVTDASLNVLSPSLWECSGAHPEFLTNFDESAATPFVTGCTMLINRKAKDSVLWQQTDKATMHDAFITLCVFKAHGEVVPLRESLMYYRQHGDNTLGAYSRERGSLTYKLKHIGYVLRKDWALLRMLHALGYGSIFKFLKYKSVYKRRCREAENKKKGNTE